MILYNTLVQSILRYCIVIWGGLYDNALYNLAVCQNTILKIILKKDRMYPNNLLYSLTNMYIIV